MSAPYYADDLVTLYHGDCREIDAWLAADVLVTDPPYGIAWRKGENRARSSKRHEGIANDGDTSARDDVLAMFGGRPAAVFGSFYAPFPADVRQVLVWQKPADAGVVGSVTGYRRDVEAIFLCGAWPRRSASRSSVLRSAIANIGSPTSPAGRTGHPHSKPVDLIASLIEHAPTGVVADPFAGSGSTLVAARLLDRKCVGVELDERYCETIAKRLAQDVLDFGEAS